jgi:hypothetical protein
MAEKASSQAPLTIGVHKVTPPPPVYQFWQDDSYRAIRPLTLNLVDRPQQRRCHAAEIRLNEF